MDIILREGYKEEMKQLLTAFFSLLLLPLVAEACSCGSPQAVKAQFDWARAVIEAKVVSKKETITKDGYSGFSVAIEISRVWKGKAEPGRYEIRTGSGGGDCGYSFEVGKEYLIYAGGINDSDLVASICSRTREISRATEDFAFLGKPIKEIP